jgi:hypothetical protein
MGIGDKYPHRRPAAARMITAAHIQHAFPPQPAPNGKHRYTTRLPHRLPTSGHHPQNPEKSVSTASKIPYQATR